MHQLKRARDLGLSKSGDDFDWEYEYEKNDTEDFYFTLDLTSHVPPIARRRKIPTNTLSIEDSSCTKPSTFQTVSPERTINTAEGSSPPRTTKSSPSIRSESSLPQNRIQILDLHGDQPLINYRNSFYACHWASVIGTDLLFTVKCADNNSSNTSDKPLSANGPTRKYNLLSAPSLRLVAKPANLSHRLVPTVRAASSSSAAPPQAQPTLRSNNDVPTSTREASRIRNTTSKVRQGQSSFLSRLAAIKEARGETDGMPLDSNEYNQTSPRKKRRGESKPRNENAEDLQCSSTNRGLNNG